MSQSQSLRSYEFTGASIALRLMSAKDPNDPGERGSSSRGRQKPDQGEDLPYKIELWNDAKTAVEQVLAVTASASIGHAAFYAAAREHAERYVTLKHKDSVINRWNAPSH
jgi:hypothetical protein